MANLTVRPEGVVGNPFKASLLVPAFRPPVPRSLVTDERFRPPVELPAGYDMRGPGEPVVPLPQITIVQDEPAAAWSVDMVAVTPLTSVWLDDPAQGRYHDKRRSVTITNHDTQFGVWIRHVQQSVIAGGYLAPSRSISLPLGSSCRVYAQGINPAGSNVSFYQLGSTP